MLLLCIKGGVDMPTIKPITDLRDTTKISDLCHATKDPIFITKNGYGDMVIMSIEAYEEMLEERKIDTLITDAEERYAKDGETLDAKEVLSTLRRKYLG